MTAAGLAVATRAGAQELRAPGPSGRAERPVVLSHHGQFGIALSPGTGYRTVVPYQRYKDCGDSSGVASKRVCTRRAPTFVDLELSHGTFARVDLLLSLRLGLEKDFGGGRPFVVAPGFRTWLDPDARAKAFTVMQLVLDHTAQNAAGVADTDFGGRVALGFMYDVVRNLGIYAQAGATLGLRRWLRLEADLGAGAQMRF